MPARASDDPINLRKPRRETASIHSEAPLGNSRCIISRNSGLPASSSRLRQNSGPFFFSISACTWSRSSLSFLPGQTASSLPFCFSSLIYVVPSLTGLASFLLRSRHFRAGLSHLAPSGLEHICCNLSEHPQKTLGRLATS